MRSLVAGVVATLAVAPLAVAETFDELAARAKTARLDEVVYSVAASCTTGDDVQKRQCRAMLERLKAARPPGKQLLVEVERGAFTVGAWDPAKHGVTFRITACVLCVKPLAIDGKAWHVVLDHSAPKVEQGSLVTTVLFEDAMPFPDEAAARAWISSLTPVRVDVLVAAPTLKVVGDKQVVELTSSGFRVVTPCTGKIVASHPAAANLPPDKKACAQ